MHTILNSFLENKKTQSGLMLLPLTTGSGKTHHVLEYISELLSREREQKVFFITTQKKNLPVEKLRSMYHGDDFDARVLRIQSLMDCIKENLTDELINEIKTCQPILANSSKFIMLVAVRKEMLRIGDENNDTCRNAEREFRDELLNFLRKECNKQDKEDILYKIKHDKSWKWVGKLYPMVYTAERQVYFLSMDKFMLPYDTLVESAGKIIDSEWFKGAYVFIDEFDATKETILNRIIDDKNKRINLITLSKKIIQGLNYTDFPAIYTDTPINVEAIERSRSNFNQISDEFCLQYVFKTSDDIKAADSFLFHDNGYWGQTTEKNLIIETDTKRKQNVIKNKEEKNGNKTYTLYKLLSVIQQRLTYFQNGISIIAKNYVNKKNVKLKTAVDSFLNLFLDYPNNDYISSQVMSVLRSEQKIENDLSKMDKFDLSFYKNGFRYTRLHNDELNNAEQSNVILYAYNETPEAIMEKMAKIAKIVGISATATLKTVLGNYDIDYLQRKLLDGYYKLSLTEEDHLRKFLNESRKFYDKTNINVEFTDFSAKEYDDDKWLLLLSEDYSQKIIEKLNNEFGDDPDKAYIKSRFFRISWAFKQFIIHEDIKSFLCFMNLHPKEGNELSRDILTFIFDKILNEDGKSKNMICYLNKEDYEKNLESIKDRLAQGEKLFVISVYKTLGTGQNPQYKIPDGLEVVKINDRYESDEKDFDAIYLDKPTNIISNLYDTSKQIWNDKEFLKFVFEMEYLFQNGDISDAQKKTLINAGAKKMCGARYIQTKEKVCFESMQPFKGLATQLLNQGCGRICRTNKKNKNIYIFADRDISTVIDPNVRTSIPLSPEFEKFLDELEKIGIEEIAPTKFEEKAKKVSIDTARTIGNYLNWENDWKKNKINAWKQMRLYSLANPTILKQEYKFFPLCDMYVEQPECKMVYWYDQSENYGKIDALSFDERKTQEVSEEECQLQLLMKIPNIKSNFEKNGFATFWKQGEFMMSPSLYNRIYKGALGEVVGKQIFNDTLNVNLVDIENPSVYEFFDYKIPQTNIYVDFKKWREIDLGQELSEKIRTDIFQKAKKCNAEKVFIVNIISETERQCRSIKRDGCILYEIPQLYVEEGGDVRLSIESIQFILENK